MPIELPPIQRGDLEMEREQIILQMERMRLALQELQYGSADGQVRGAVGQQPEQVLRPQDGQDGRDGQDGKDGVSYEFIYTSTSEPTLTTDKYPLNSWGFDRPRSAGGQVWSTDRPSLSDANPYVWVAQRRVAGFPSRGAAVSSSWSTPRLTASRGAAGEDGSGIEYIFTATEGETLDTAKYPSNSWGFDEGGTVDGQVWTDGAPTLTTALKVLWSAHRPIQGSPSQGAEVSAAWSAPVIVGRYGEDGERGQDGEDGDDGQPGAAGADGADGIGVEYVFTRSNSATLPASKRPSNAWGFDSPGTVDGQVWTDGAPSLDSSNQYLWRGQRRTEGSPVRGDVISANWLAPTIVGRWGQDGGRGTQGIQGIPGADGDDANGIEFVFAITQTDAAIPAGQLPSNSWGYDQQGTVGGLVWHDAAPNVSTSHPFLRMAQRKTVGSPNTGDTVDADWSAPAIIAHYGRDGTDGLAGAQGVAGPGFEILYTVTASNTLETGKRPNNSWGYLSGGTSDGQVWARTPPTTSESFPFLWITQRRVEGGTASGGSVTDTWSVPTVYGHFGVDGLPGEAGEDGISYNFRGEWSNTEVYQINDVARYIGSSYISLEEGHQNFTPGRVTGQRSVKSTRPRDAVTGSGTAADPYVIFETLDITSRLIAGRGASTLTVWQINQVTEIGTWIFILRPTPNTQFSMTASVFGPGVNPLSGTAAVTSQRSGDNELRVTVDVTQPNSTIVIHLQDNDANDVTSATLLVEPAPTDKWDLFVQRGNNGNNGNDGADGADGADGTDGARGADGAPGLGVEYIFTRTATNTLDTTKYPNNAWGYDTPGTRNGQVWTDGAPELNEEYPYLLRAERKVPANTAAGAAVTDTWSVPVILGYYGAVFRGPGSFQFDLDLSAWDDDAVEAELPNGNAVNGDRVTVNGQLTHFQGNARYFHFDEAVETANKSTAPTADNYAFYYLDASNTEVNWTESRNVETMEWQRIKEFHFRLSDMVNWVTGSGVTSTNLVHFAVVTNRNNFGIFRIESFDEATNSVSAENLIKIRTRYLTSRGTWSNDKVGLYWIGADFLERNLLGNPFTQYRETRIYQEEGENWGTTNTFLDGDLIVRGTIRGDALVTTEPIVRDSVQIDNALIERRHLNNDLFFYINSIGRDATAEARAFAHKSATTSTTFSTIGSFSATRLAIDTNMALRIHELTAYAWSRRFYNRDQGRLIIRMLFRAYERVYINESNSLTGATLLKTSIRYASNRNLDGRDGSYFRATYHGAQEDASTHTFSLTQWPVGQTRYIIVQAQIGRIQKDYHLDSDPERSRGHWLLITESLQRAGRNIHETFPLETDNLDSFTETIRVPGIGGTEMLTVKPREALVVPRVTLSGLGFTE